MKKTSVNILCPILLVAFFYYLIPGFPHLFVGLVGGQWTNAAIVAILFLVLIQLWPMTPTTCPKCGCDLNSKHTTEPLPTLTRVK